MHHRNPELRESRFFYNRHKICLSFIPERDIILLTWQWTRLFFAQRKTLSLSCKDSHHTNILEKTVLSTGSRCLCKIRNVRDPWRIVSQPFLKSFSWLKKKTLHWSLFSSGCYTVTIFSSTVKYLKAFSLVYDSVTCQFWLSPWLLIQGTLSHSHSTCLCSQQCPHSWCLLPSCSSLLPWFSCNYMAAPSSCISLCTFLIHLLIPPLLHLLIPPLFLHTSSSPLMLGLLLQLYPRFLVVLSITTSLLLSGWCFFLHLHL